MCKGGLIMDVVNVEQAKIAEEAGVTLSFTLYHIMGIYLTLTNFLYNYILTKNYPRLVL